MKKKLINKTNTQDTGIEAQTDAERENMREAGDEDMSASARRLLGTRGSAAFDEDEADDTPVEKVGFWENYWYHHKWKTIIIGFFAIVGIATLVQILTRTEPDINIMYAGPAYVPSAEYNELCAVFENIMPEDYNGDGKKSVAFKNLMIKSDMQIAADKTAAEQAGVEYMLDSRANSESKSVFSTEILAGEYVVLLLDKSLYDEALTGGGLSPLSEVFDGEVMGAADEYSVRLGDMKLYKYYKAMQILPEDTLLCVRSVSTMKFFENSKKREKIRENHLDYIRSAAAFEYPVGFVDDGCE